MQPAGKAFIEALLMNVSTKFSKLHLHNSLHGRIFIISLYISISNLMLLKIVSYE